MTIKTFEFEGQQRTVAEIRKMVPRLSDAGIRKNLAAGRNTVLAMMTFDPKRASLVGLKRHYAATGKPSHMAAQINGERDR